MTLETIEDFVEKYRRLCGHIARSFIAKRKRQLEDGGNSLQPWGSLPTSQAKNSHAVYASSQVRAAMATRTLQFNAEDLASAALVKLTQCPQVYWNQTGRNGRNNYVERVIMNAIIDEFAKQKKVESHELCASEPYGDPDYHDFFDTLPGRDGLAEATQIKFDAERVKSCLGSLTEGERLVIQFYFGLNGLKPLGQRAIADKLARTPFWVEHRMTSGLMKLRKELGYQISSNDHQWLSSNRLRTLKDRRIKSYEYSTLHETPAAPKKVHGSGPPRKVQARSQAHCAIR
jgi:RNA polymerase sigma factor (sigma-70 family)